MNRISVQQLFELRQNTVGHNIITGEAGTGKNFLVKREISHILENTEDDILLITGNDEYDFPEYRERVSVWQGKNSRSLTDYIKSKTRKGHIYAYAEEIPQILLHDIIREAEKSGMVDVTLICNGNIKKYADIMEKTCITVLDTFSMTTDTGNLIAKKAGFRNADYIAGYINIFVTDGNIWEISF